jgi:hypothetical protein
VCRQPRVSISRWRRRGCRGRRGWTQFEREDQVAFRPPAWDANQRVGRIEVAAGTPVLIVEGVGAGRRSLGSLVDTIVWVRSDLDETERRNAARVAIAETDPEGLNDWMAEEGPFSV